MYQLWRKDKSFFQIVKEQYSGHLKDNKNGPGRYSKNDNITVGKGNICILLTDKDHTSFRDIKRTLNCGLVYGER